MTSVDNLRRAIDDITKIKSRYDMTPDQLSIWKLLRIQELEARIKLHQFENSLLETPLTSAERERLRLQQDRAQTKFDQWIINQMSDYEFARCFRDRW
jgi:hypothetical protein